MLDDIWDGILEPFADDPNGAFVCAQTFHLLKEAIKRGPEGRLAVIKALDDGIQKLYPYSEAHKAGYELFLLAVEGKLRPQHDPLRLAREARLAEQQCPQCPKASE
ncbi:MAG: hypothetical protein ACREBC_16410 [Pyrinomonadaceae bacterium]